MCEEKKEQERKEANKKCKKANEKKRKLQPYTEDDGFFDLGDYQKGSKDKDK